MLKGLGQKVKDGRWRTLTPPAMMKMMFFSHTHVYVSVCSVLLEASSSVNFRSAATWPDRRDTCDSNLVPSFLRFFSLPFFLSVSLSFTLLLTHSPAHFSPSVTNDEGSNLPIKANYDRSHKTDHFLDHVNNRNIKKFREKSAQRRKLCSGGGLKLNFQRTTNAVSHVVTYYNNAICLAFWSKWRRNSFRSVFDFNFFARNIFFRVFRTI